MNEAWERQFTSVLKRCLNPIVNQCESPSKMLTGVKKVPAVHIEMPIEVCTC